jgi:hypothetical protein
VTILLSRASTVISTTLWLLGGMLVLPVSAAADDFALSVSPPRFELTAKPGETVRAVAELANASQVATTLNFATAEWELKPDGGLATSNELKGSCRPWVAIERRQVVLAAKTQLRYRFEVTPPPDTPPTECRFALLVSGGEERVSASPNIMFPVSAQIALIVYVAVGDVKPKLEITKAMVVSVGGNLAPALLVKNSGTRHGRLTAFLSGTDAVGKKREFSPSTLPILPGETRVITLAVDNGRDAIEAPNDTVEQTHLGPDTIAFPLTVHGTINDGASSYSFDGEFAP